MDKKLKMVPWATDEGKYKFVIFMINRGANKANAFVWVTPEAPDEWKVEITTFGDVISYFTQLASPLYFGEDRPKELMDSAIDVLNEAPEEFLDVLIADFKDKAHRRNEGQIAFEKECIEGFAKEVKKGNCLLFV